MILVIPAVLLLSAVSHPCSVSVAAPGRYIDTVSPSPGNTRQTQIKRGERGEAIPASLSSSSCVRSQHPPSKSHIPVANRGDRGEILEKRGILRLRMRAEKFRLCFMIDKDKDNVCFEHVVVLCPEGFE